MSMPEQFLEDDLADESLPEPKSALTHVATVTEISDHSLIPLPPRTNAAHRAT